jgi:tetratricopeptide (TPR) repeat protein
VSNISFALNYLLHGYNVTGYHVVNMFIHLATAITLYFLMRFTLTTPALQSQFKQDSPIPLIAALLWAVHPVHTQSVTYIVQRMNSMAAMFYLLALLFYVKGRLAKEHHSTWPWFVGCFFWGLMAFGSKQIAATLPFFILLYEWYFIQDMKPAWIKKLSIYTLASLILTAILTAVYLGQNKWDILLFPSAQAGFSTAERLLTQSRVVLYYISLIIFPHPSRLNLDYDYSISRSLTDPATTLASVLILAGLIGFALWKASKHRLLSFAILWYFGNLAIESSVASLEMVYEHRTYLPSMFLLLALVLLTFRWFRIPRVIYMATAAVCLIFCFWTYQRNSVWNDPVALWRSSAEKSSTKARPYNNLGNALSNVGRSEEAIACYREALKRDPDYYIAHISLGAALMHKGKVDEAISHYSDALKSKPDYAPTHQSLGIAFTRNGNLDKALFHYQEALKRDPDYADAHVGIGLVLKRKGELEEAADHFRKALAVDPGNTHAKTNLSNLSYGRKIF